VPHFSRTRHDLEEAFIEIWDFEIIPAVAEGVLGNDVVGRSIEKNLKIQRSVVYRMLLKSRENFSQAPL